MFSNHFKYQSIAVGGTFDHVHEGHKALLARAFESGELVYIGVTSDDYVKKAGKRVLHNFEERKAQLVEYLSARYPFRRYIITKLEDRLGPTIFEPRIEAIVVSTETFPVAEYANAKRIELGQPEMNVEVVQMIGEQLNHSPR